MNLHRQVLKVYQNKKIKNKNMDSLLKQIQQQKPKLIQQKSKQIQEKQKQIQEKYEINIFNRTTIKINSSIKAKLHLINKNHLDLFKYPKLMNQTIRQLKFKTKLSDKLIHKSSLPHIDPNLSLQTKFKHALINHNDSSPLQNYQTINQVTNSTFLKKEPPTNTSIVQNELISQQQNIETAHNLNFNNPQNFKEIFSKNNTVTNHQNAITVQNSKEISSNGLDMWNLNKNLKQFSETRKIEFYKNKNSNHSTIQSPYSIMSKTKTQQIKSMYKVYGGNLKNTENSSRQRQKSQGQLRMKKFYDPSKKIKQKDSKSLSTIKKNQTFSPLGNTLYGTLPVRKGAVDLNTTLKNYQNKLIPSSSLYGENSSSSSNINPYLRTFINGSHLKRQPSNRNIHILQMNSFKVKEDEGKIRKPSNSLRKNRFQKIQSIEQKSKGGQNIVDKTFIEECQSKSLDCAGANFNPQKNMIEVIQEQKFEDLNEQFCPANVYRSSSSPAKYDMSKKGQQKKRQYEYNKSIDRINRALLKSSSNYLEEFYQFSTMPNSKIQYYIDSLNHPQLGCNLNENSKYKEQKSSYNGIQGCYDFQFRQIGQEIQKGKGKRGSSLEKPKNKNNKNTKYQKKNPKIN